MKNLCVWLLALVVFSALNGFSQEVALAHAPDALMSPSSSSSSLGLAGSASLGSASGAAILPVRQPVAETGGRFASADWTLLGAVATVRLLDYKSTVKAMSDPANFREDELPNALVHNRPALGAFEASTVVVNYYAYRVLISHRHGKLARVGQTINLAALGWAVGRNYYELNAFWPREETLRVQASANAASVPGH